MIIFTPPEIRGSGHWYSLRIHSEPQGSERRKNYLNTPFADVSWSDAWLEVTNCSQSTGFAALYCKTCSWVSAALKQFSTNIFFVQILYHSGPLWRIISSSWEYTAPLMYLKLTDFYQNFGFRTVIMSKMSNDHVQLRKSTAQGKIKVGHEDGNMCSITVLWAV